MSNFYLLFGLMMIFILCSLPVGISLGLSTLIVMLTRTAIPVSSIIQNSFTGLNSFTLLAIPFFILAGNLMSYGGISKRLVVFFDSILGGITGGLGIVTTAACMFFAAISGSGPATVSAIGGMMIPEMEKRGYDRSYAAGLSAVAGGIGVIIPPSIPFVVYAVAASASVGDMFLAGIIPGILIGLALMAVGYVIARKHGWKGQPKEERVPVFKAFWDGLPALISPVIILGGIYGGIFTPTEAAVVAVVYSAVVGIFVYRELDAKTLYKALRDTAEMNGMIGLATGLSLAFGSFLAMQQIPSKIAAGLTSAISSGWLMMLIILVILLFVGCFMDNISACLILTPVFLPIMKSFGYSDIHFGVVMTIAFAIGFVTPPFGGNLFVASAISKLPMEKVARGSVPFLIAMGAVMLACAFIPQLVIGILG